MLHAALSGRLGKDAKPIRTKTGKSMAGASLAVDVSPRGQEASVWVRVIAFGKLADLLALHMKGDLLSATGRMELQHWTAGDGTERESWQLVADALYSARTAHPGGKGVDPERGPFDDDLPF